MFGIQQRPFDPCNEILDDLLIVSVLLLDPVGLLHEFVRRLLLCASVNELAGFHIQFLLLLGSITDVQLFVELLR